MLAAKRKSMSESKASRTLVKSTPELWSEVSNAASLQRHMDQFGEIRITKLEPESAVAWEGEHTRGTITLEASGWGTKVSLTAEGVGSAGFDGTEPEAAGQAEAGSAGFDGTEPEAAGQAEAGSAAHLVDPGPPERVDNRFESAPPERLDSRFESRPPERLDPPHEIKAEMPDRTIPPQRDWLDAPTRRPLWTRRLGDALRRWFGPPPPQGSDSLAPVPAAPVSAEPEQPPPALASPPVAVAAVKPPPPPEPPAEPLPASTAALDAALDSLGQAHHRPYSRA